MKSFKQIIAVLLLIGAAVPALEAGHGGHHHAGGRHRSGHGHHHRDHGRNWGYGGAFAGGLIAGSALGYGAGYYNNDDVYTSYPVTYSNQTVVEQPIEDEMDIE